MAFVRHQRELESLPGEKDLYCNTGYNLLARIVAKVTGEPFPEWMSKNVFQSLKMSATVFFDRAPGVVPNQADSYIFHSGIGFVRSADQVFAPGSSSIWTTAEDMAKWLINLGTADVGGGEAMKLMQTKGQLSSGRSLNYGFGLFLDKFHHLEAVSHGGGWEGFERAVFWIPAERLGVAILSNRAEIDAEKLAGRIAEIWLDLPRDAEPTTSGEGSTVKARNPLQLAPEKLAMYVGDYWSEELEVVYHIELWEANLTVRYRFHDCIPLVPLGDDRFATGPIPEIEAQTQIAFTRQEDGVSEMNLSARRIRKIRFKRVSLPKF